MTTIPNTPRSRDAHDPPLRLAHVLFVLWIAGSVAWALYAAMLAHEHSWWELRPLLAAALVLAPPVLAHVLALLTIRITGNPRFGAAPPGRPRRLSS